MKSTLAKAGILLDRLTDLAGWIAGLALFAITMVILIDVGGRFFLNRPLEGSLELVELGMLILGAFSMIYTASKNEHLRAELLNTRLPPRAKAALEMFGGLLGFTIWIILSYRVTIEALRVYRSEEVLPTLHIMRGPFLIVASGALWLFALALLRRAFKPAPQSDRMSEEF